MFAQEMVGKSHEIAVSFGEMQMTGKNAQLVSINMSGGESSVESIPSSGGYVDKVSPRQCFELEFRFLVSPEDANGNANLIWDYFDKSPRIKNKKVGDCSIQELLFAVRSKLKGK